MIRLTTMHHLHAVLFVLLLISGISLYLAPLRTWFNELQFPLVAFHLLVSLLYLLLVLIQLRRLFVYIRRKTPKKKFNLLLNLTAFFLWSVTGAVMYFQSQLPSSLTNPAVWIHGMLTFLFFPWTLFHSVTHAFHIRVPWPIWWRSKKEPPEYVKENIPGRRDFIKFTGLGIIFLFAGGLIKWVQPILTAAGDETRMRGYFRIYNVTSNYPRYEDREWELTIDGLVNNPVTIGRQELMALPEIAVITDFHCVTGWSVRNVEMRGVLIRDVLDNWNIMPHGGSVTAYSGDQMYYDTFTADQLIAEDAMLVFTLNDDELVNAQGYPCRLFHPDMYGYKSVKWLERLEFTEERRRGYWQVNGDYDLNGYL
ncbi:molybdopterin-dependent oxidoreductase [Alkalicoccus halolimnae]|uniref:Molybdopterin-dependent oxidoreductase n=1 Tax=Alkalicoccus halolimnae TaxID=1667239 RepID=A0A5C7F8C4_9BACI|nr:molybdopterin-dependent oxidoreductase [Alkalicoccus halolimnae]TXF86951.1 molybdopterin-dependent oxidoreductase [Alkalicoccus halolimnae]